MPAMVDVDVELVDEAVPAALATFEQRDDAFRRDADRDGVVPIEENRVGLRHIEAAVGSADAWLDTLGDQLINVVTTSSP